MTYLNCMTFNKHPYSKKMTYTFWLTLEYQFDCRYYFILLSELLF